MKKIYFLNIEDNYEEYPDFGFTRLFSTDLNDLTRIETLENKTRGDSREYFVVREHPHGRCYDGGGEKMLTRMRPKKSLMGLVGAYVKVNDHYEEITHVSEEKEEIHTRDNRYWFDEVEFFRKD